jgi:hypothetical protein
MAKGSDATHHELVCQAVFNNERFLYIAKLQFVICAERAPQKQFDIDRSIC